ncbi:GNAT family N-acetyltransferase [Halothiobacillus sp.]|uniref:GNAT family N-acetyltransferase n=1 Tax=Halothiobacillus sp. TaxID=1891311 RepID=UPI0026223A0F|nr:GNAT family N-acetyltransferase [Halothiobacillus sp.]
MDFHIGPATSEDIDALVALLFALFSIEQDFVPDEVAQRRGLALLLAYPLQGRIFVARHTQQGVVGMVSAQLVSSTAIGERSAWIEDMVVHEDFRGQGIGKALLAHVSEWAKENRVGRLQLLADADNESALGFYDQLGWQPTRLFAWKKIVL